MLYLILNVVFFIGVTLGQPNANLLPQAPSGDNCLMKCTNELYLKAPHSDAMSLLKIQPVKVGNGSAMCPHVNDTTQLDKSCGPVKQFKTCTDACPDSQYKKATLASFTAVQMLCVDKSEEVKKALPCLSNTCAEAQGSCISKCGSIEESTKKIMIALQQMRGGGQTNPLPPGGTSSGVPPPATGATGQDVDMSQMMQIIGETCTSLQCFIDCSEPQVTKLCGKDAFMVQRDLTWALFSQGVQGLSSMGLHSLPDQCKQAHPVVGGANETGGLAGNETLVPGGAPPMAPPPMGPPVASGGTTNETVPAISTPTSETSPATTTNATSPAEKAKEGKTPPTEAGESKQHENKGTLAVLSSTMLVLTSVFTLVWGRS